jgi:hypothetical protein
MAKLKIAGINNGTTTDRYVSPILISGNHIGGTGGLTSLSTNTIQPAVKIGSASAGTGSIIAQKGIHKFRVTDGTNTGTCTLVNKASGSLAAGEMSIAVTTTGGSFYASRITNKFVYDFAGNKYRYWFATATATFVQVANA